ncbi:MAG: DUF115 domain-containing protein [Verrucomicrobia bacterium]|nr:DUF115 domain-containing protein [Verrucomicrobiota bacterium]
MATAVMDAAALADVDVVCVCGISETLYGSLSSWLKKGEERYLVFIEKDAESFARAKEGPLGKDERVRLFLCAGQEEKVFRQIAWEFLLLRFGYLPEQEEQFAHLKQIHRYVNVFASDSKEQGMRVLHNVFNNLRHLPRAHFGPQLEGACKGIPAVVCGAGPSLDKVAEHLKGLEGRALVIAGGSALTALTKYGVKPDISAGLDPQPPIHRFLEQENFETPFFYQARFSSEILDKVHGPLVWMPGSGSCPLESWIHGGERLDSGWTVANFCAAIAFHLGCNPIVFVGTDFSCGEGIYAGKIAGEENRDALVPTGGGRFSKMDWLLSAEWMGGLAHAHPEVEWINASDGTLPGIECKELADIPFETHYDLAALLHGAIQNAPLCESVTGIETLRASAQKCLELCDQKLSLWEKAYPHSPKEKGEYALLEVEMEQEVCTRYFLEPLWNIWKHPIFRKESHPFARDVHQILFHKSAIGPLLQELSCMH